ncbi:integrase family protein [Segniliparus rotundus DSM 44985]|uniref:Integrase family protein n=1 Tax=Segniliparus rotundus (strain ATCC BAA-972 / CDC 1076 / CIP 108378 / DSM 44985 / JCM 13578) TaxID=640132 RepID=D6ZD55_SEGRD|nr:tyrosine-type recombinase/integrase [Segniliparus rotundus]ADG99242.1 integrase family protein [Segniliparus rotundus DSM 44985]
MPRPIKPLGTWGEVSANEVAPGKWVAKGRYRDWDGVSRLAEAVGPTETQAKHNLKARFATRKAPNTGPISRETTVAELWEKFRESLAMRGGSVRTIDTYSGAAKKITAALGGVRLHECDPLTLYNFLLALTPDAAHTCRSVLSGMFELAIAGRAIERNPVKDTPSTAKTARGRKGQGKARKRPRALEPAQSQDLIRQLRESELPCPPVSKGGKQVKPKGYCPTVKDYAAGADLADVFVMFAGTGLRIGELLGLLWSDIDLKEKTLTLSGKVTRGNGVGLIREEFTKSEAGDERIFALPPKAVAMLAERKKRQALTAPHGFVSATKIQKDAELLPLVFPAANGALRDPCNTQRQWRRVRVALGLEWVTSHTYRKTTATSIKEAGFDDLAASDQLGHAHVSVTQNVYYGRNKLRREVADVLDKNIG